MIHWLESFLLLIVLFGRFIFSAVIVSVLISCTTVASIACPIIIIIGTTTTATNIIPTIIITVWIWIVAVVAVAIGIAIIMIIGHKSSIRTTRTIGYCSTICILIGISGACIWCLISTISGGGRSCSCCCTLTITICYIWSNFGQEEEKMEMDLIPKQYKSYLRL